MSLSLSQVVYVHSHCWHSSNDVNEERLTLCQSAGTFLAICILCFALSSMGLNYRSIMYQYYADQVFHESVCRTCANELRKLHRIMKWFFELPLDGSPSKWLINVVLRNFELNCSEIRLLRRPSLQNLLNS